MEKRVRRQKKTEFVVDARRWDGQDGQQGGPQH
jgi:hypothetical protein